MTVDKLRAERKALIQRKKELTEAGADPLELQMVREELISVNSALRRLTPGHRIGAKRKSGDLASADRQQYRDWSKSWGELEADGMTWAQVETEDFFRRVIAEAGETLTVTEKRYFDLWAGGMKMREVAAACGVNKATVSRSIAFAKRKLNAAAERLRIADADYEGPGVRLDVSDPAAAKMLISACTATQIVYLYLYYGEWLSCTEIGKLLGVNKTTALRSVTRGLIAIGKLFPGKEILLDNMDALGNLAYTMYTERSWTESELTPAKPVRIEPGELMDWGRRLLGLRPAYPRRETYADRPPVTIATSGGDVADVRDHRTETMRVAVGKLLAALLERWRERTRADADRPGTLRRWLTALFEKIKTAAGAVKGGKTTWRN